MIPSILTSAILVQNAASSTTSVRQLSTMSNVWPPSTSTKTSPGLSPDTETSRLLTVAQKPTSQPVVSGTSYLQRINLFTLFSVASVGFLYCRSRTWSRIRVLRKHLNIPDCRRRPRFIDRWINELLHLNLWLRSLFIKRHLHNWPTAVKGLIMDIIDTGTSNRSGPGFDAR